MKFKFENMPFLMELELSRKDFSEREISKAFGNSLKKLRWSRGLSLNALSEYTDMPNPTINRYENGINIPTITQALKLAQFFGVSVEEMIGFGLMDENGKKTSIGNIVEYSQAKK